MSISLKTHKLLWGKSGSRCAICRIELHEDSITTDEDAVIGEECHIIAQSRNGPRGDDPLPLEDRDKLSNLILLCRNHHKIIDSKIEEYPVERLQKIKGDHEEYVKKALAVELDRELLEMVSTVDLLSQKARFEEWDNSFCDIVYGNGLSLEKEFLKSIEELDESLFRRFRVTKFDHIENEIDNFKFILHDFINVYRRFIDFTIDDDQKERYFTERFYKIKEYDVERYPSLLERYNYHSDLLEDLIFELTRSANRIVEMIRKDLAPGYRQREGYLILHRGMDENLKEHAYRLLYRSEEERYPGLKHFAKIRSERNEGIGQGDKYIDSYL